MRRIAEGITRMRFWQVPIYIMLYLVITTVLTMPMTIYEEFLREQSIWAVEPELRAVVRRLCHPLRRELHRVHDHRNHRVRRHPRQQALLVGLGYGDHARVLVIGVAIAPVFISPLLNHYKPLREGELKQNILALARSEGIPVTNVYEFDASKQTKRMSANVSGLFGTTRISMNDNLLNRGSDREALAVLGHEMGHYVLSHVVTGIVENGLVILIGFAFTAWGFGFLTDTFGGVWDVRSVDDPAGLPVLMALATVFFLVATPVTNTITRSRKHRRTFSA